MLDILAITSPIYIAIALGYLSTRVGLFGRGDMRVLGTFVINLALPALLFNALAQRQLGDILNGQYMLVYALGSLLTLAVGITWARRGAGQEAVTAAYWGMGFACPNSGFVGYPILLLVLGPVAAVILGLNMLVENLLILPVTMALAEGAAQRGGSWQATLRQSVVKLARNPMVLGLVAGVVASAVQWAPPAPLGRTITLFAQASAALSLFAIGGTLGGLSVRGLAKPMAHIVTGKLLVHPLIMLAVLLAAEWVGFSSRDEQFRTGIVLTAACPMMSIYPLLAQKHERDGMAAAALLGATVASFFSISVLLWVLRQLPGWAP